MQIPLVCFLTLCTSIFSQFLTATPSPGVGSHDSSLTTHVTPSNNLTLGIPEPPVEFGLTYAIGGPKLRTTSCLMNVVAALKELALMDWDSKVIDGTEYRLDAYPEVSVVITTPKRKRNIQARFVTWAVCLGIFEIIARKEYEFAQFEMSWEGQVLGWVQFVNHPTRAGSTTAKRQTDLTSGLENNSTNSPSADHAIESEPVNITNVITIDNANDAAEARLNVTFEPYGDILSIYDIFVPVMSGLADMAKFPSTYDSTGLMIGLQGFNGFICALPAIPQRTSPPILNYGWLVRAIARIPTYMLSKGRFGEVTMIIKVDEVAVGYGRLSSAPSCNDDVALPASLGVAKS